MRTECPISWRFSDGERNCQCANGSFQRRGPRGLKSAKEGKKTKDIKPSQKLFAPSIFADFLFSPDTIETNNLTKCAAPVSGTYSLSASAPASNPTSHSSSTIGSGTELSYLAAAAERRESCCLMVVAEFLGNDNLDKEATDCQSVTEGSGADAHPGSEDSGGCGGAYGGNSQCEDSAGPRKGEAAGGCYCAFGE
jgi:hypothetical protein